MLSKIEFLNKINKMNGLMTNNQYLEIYNILIMNAPCNMLVFGLGNDSYLWNEINKGGKTYFIENSSEWIKKFKNLNIFKYEYTTQIKDADKLIDKL